MAGSGFPVEMPAVVAQFYDPAVNGFWVGVAVFLMLSMVLLLRSLDGNPDIKHYFMRRVKRIWPIYFGSLVLIFLFFSADTEFHITPWDIVGYFTFTEYYIHPYINGPLSVFWTLQLEEAVYLFIPLIHRSRHKEWIGGSLVAIGLAWTFILFSTNLITSDLATRSLLWYTPPGWMLAYGLGILIYLGMFKGEAWRIMRWLVPPALVIGGFGLPFSVPSTVVPQFEFFYPLVTIGFAAVIANPPSFLRYASWVGEGSYAMYATHLFILLTFGIIALPLIFATSFAVEYVLRPKEISTRLNLPTFRLHFRL